MSKNVYASVRRRRANRFRNQELFPGERYTIDEVRRVYSDYNFERTRQNENGLFIVRRNAHILEEADKIAKVLKKYRGAESESKLSTAGVTVVSRGTVNRLYQLFNSESTVDEDLVRPVAEGYVKHTMYYSLLGKLGLAYNVGDGPYYVQIELDERSSTIVEAEYQDFLQEGFGLAPGQSFPHITLAKTDEESHSKKIAREINYARVEGAPVLLEIPKLISSQPATN